MYLDEAADARALAEVLDLLGGAVGLRAGVCFECACVVVWVVV